MPIKAENQIEPESLQAATHRNWTVWMAWVLLGLLGLLLAAKILFSLNIVWQIFNYPFQIDESEGMIVAEVGLMGKGVNIFSPPTPDIFISAPYTPLYYLLNWPAVAVMPGSFKPGRLISFVATLGIAFLLYKLVGWYTAPRQKNNKPDRIAGILAGAVWGSLGLVAFWGGMVKPDITALLLSLLGIYFTAHWWEKPGTRLITGDYWLYAAAITFALAALTKQTAFAGVGTTFVFILLKKPLSSLKFATVYVVLGFGPMLAMNLLSNGGFWYHIVTVHELPWSSYNYWKFASAFLQNYQLYFVIALLFLIFYLGDMYPKLTKKQNPFPTLANERATLLLGYTAAALVVTLSAGTYGGNHNHLLEFAAAMSLCVGLSVARLREGWKVATRRRWLGWVYPVVLLTLSVQVLAMFVAEARVKPADFPVLGSLAPTRAVLESLKERFADPEWLGLQYRPPQPDEINGYGRVAAYITNDSGALVYSDNVSLVLSSGKQIFTTDTFTQTHATRYGRWDESKIIQLIKEQKFSLIVLRERIDKRLNEGRNLEDIYVSPGIAQAILENYGLTCPDRASIYEPKNKPKKCGS